MRKRRSKPLGLSLGALTLLATFEPTAQAKTLSWEECVRLATDTNPALQASVKNLISSEDVALADRSGFFPQISAGFQYSYSNSEIVTSGTVVGGANTSSSYTASVNASENLFNGLYDLAKIRQGEANFRLAGANLQSLKAQISYNLKSAFEGLRYAQDTLSLSKDIATRREQNLRLVQLRFQDGQENKGSVLLYQAYLLDAKFSVLQSGDSLVTARAQLAQALGLDDYSDLEISGDIDIHAPPAASDLHGLAALTPAYLQAVFQEEAADASVTQARSGFFPTLGVSGNAVKSGETFFPENNQWSFTAALTIPLFNGGRDFYGTKSAIAQRAAAEYTVHDVAHQALSNLQSAQMAFVEAVEQLKVASAYLDASKVRASIARSNYNNGITSFQDWDLAETDLISRQRNYLQSQQNRIVAEAAWEQAQGVGVIK